MSEWTLEFGCHQHQGSRPEQQDFFGMSNPDMQEIMSDKGFVAVVADGMGGHDDGAKASYIAVQSFIAAYGEKKFTQTIPDAMNEALLLANRAVYRENARRGDDSDMGTTFLATVIQGQSLYWVSVGDSRLYFIRNGQIESVNKEHSYGAELDEKMRNGQLTIDQVQMESGRRHMLTSYLGLKSIPKVNASVEPFSLDPGDSILLCSDGLYNAISPQEIQAELESSRPTQEKCERLVKRALSKNRPKQDNITAVVLELGQEPIMYSMPEAPAEKEKNPVIFWSILISVMLLGVAGGFFGIQWMLSDDAPVPDESVVVSPDDGKQKPPVVQQDTVKPDAQTTTDLSGQQDQAQEYVQEKPPVKPQVQEKPFKPTRDQIRKVQKYLKTRGYYQGFPDGFDGPGTQKAVKWFQSEQAGLVESGFIDRATYDRVVKYIKKTGTAASKKRQPARITPPSVVMPPTQELPVIEETVKAGESLDTTSPDGGASEAKKDAPAKEEPSEVSGPPVDSSGAETVKALDSLLERLEKKSEETPTNDTQQ